jgi:hypothetical protein
MLSYKSAVSDCASWSTGADSLLDVRDFTMPLAEKHTQISEAWSEQEARAIRHQNARLCGKDAKQCIAETNKITSNHHTTHDITDTNTDLHTGHWLVA